MLVCSDGLWGMIGQDKICLQLDASSAQEAADALVVAANEAGGRDNISVVVCRVVED